MCGRFGLNHPHPVLADWYRVASIPELSPRYNIAPTMDIPVIRTTERGREGSMMRWGLIPYWAKNEGQKLPVLNNARTKTVTVKSTFRQSFRQRRCLIPASGFFEWKMEGKRKQPYFLSPAVTVCLFHLPESGQHGPRMKASPSRVRHPHHRL